MRSGLNRAEPSSDGCCVDSEGNPLAEGLYCNPDCEREIQNDETATPSEAGFYFKFESDPETGFPFGCPGLDGDNKWVPGKGKNENRTNIYFSRLFCLEFHDALFL